MDKIKIIAAITVLFLNSEVGFSSDAQMDGITDSSSFTRNDSLDLFCAKGTDDLLDDTKNPSSTTLSGPMLNTTDALKMAFILTSEKNTFLRILIGQFQDKQLDQDIINTIHEIGIRKITLESVAENRKTRVTNFRTLCENLITLMSQGWEITTSGESNPANKKMNVNDYFKELEILASILGRHPNTHIELAPEVITIYPQSLSSNH